MNQTWFLGDLHLGHKRIIEFSAKQRPFKTIEEHDDAICDLWQTVVGKKDVVWVLGDIGVGQYAARRIKNLKGIKQLVLGNHDNLSIREYFKYFNNVFSFKKLQTELGTFALTHIPIHPRELKFRWLYNIHGHIHGNESIDDPRYFNVNIDMDYMCLSPIPLSRIITRIRLRGAYGV